MKSLILSIFLLAWYSLCSQTVISEIPKGERLYEFYAVDSMDYLLFTLSQENSELILHNLDEDFNERWSYSLPLKEIDRGRLEFIPEDEGERGYKFFAIGDEVIIANYYNVKDNNHISFYVFDLNGFVRKKQIEYEGEFTNSKIQLILDGQYLYHFSQEKTMALLTNPKYKAHVRKISVTDLEVKEAFVFDFTNQVDIAWKAVQIEDSLMYFAGRNDDADDDGIRNPKLYLNAFNASEKLVINKSIPLRFDNPDRKFMPRITKIRNGVGFENYMGPYYDILLLDKQYMIIHGYSGVGDSKKPDALYMMVVSLKNNNLGKVRELVHRDQKTFNTNEDDRDLYALFYNASTDLTVFSYHPKPQRKLFSKREVYYKSAVYDGNERILETRIPRGFKQHKGANKTYYLANTGLVLFNFKLVGERTNYDLGYLIGLTEFEGDFGYYDEVSEYISNRSSMKNCFTYFGYKQAFVLQQLEDGTITVKEIVDK